MFLPCLKGYIITDSSRMEVHKQIVKISRSRYLSGDSLFSNIQSNFTRDDLPHPTEGQHLDLDHQEQPEACNWPSLLHHELNFRFELPFIESLHNQ